MKKIISIVLFFISAGNCFSQQVTFQKTYGIGYTFGQSVYQNTDGGYIITGGINLSSYADIYLVRTDVYGNLLWTKSFGTSAHDRGLSVQQTTDGGFIIAASSDGITSVYKNFLLIKTDANGNSLWQKSYGGSLNDEARSVQQTTDGGFIITGYVDGFGAGNKDVYLVKTDSNGDSLWTRTFGGPDEDQGNYVRQTTDGGYIIVGYTWSFALAACDIYLVKTDANGDTLWTKTLGAPGPKRDIGNSIQQTSDGGYIITGIQSFGSVDYHIYLIKTDSIGNLAWAKFMAASSHDEAYSVLQTIDGGYIVAGYIAYPPAYDPDAFLMRTDSNGDTLWTKSFGMMGADVANSLQQTADGGFIITGRLSDSTLISDAGLIKTDSLCNSICNAGSAPFTTVNQTMLQTNPATIVSSGGNVTIPVFSDSSGGTVHTLCATVGIPSAISNPQSAITISPNPTTNNFTITFPNTINKGMIEIYTVLGKKIYEENISNISQKEIQLKNIKAGIYFVKVRDGEKEYCEKLVIE